jgi:hypothetical protein
VSDPFFNNPNPPIHPPEPRRSDPMTAQGWARRSMTVVALGAAILLVLIVLFAITRETPELQTAGPVALPPPAATGPGTTGRGTQTSQPNTPNTPSTGQSRPLPAEQDPIEQNTRP